MKVRLSHFREVAWSLLSACVLTSVLWAASPRAQAQDAVLAYVAPMQQASWDADDEAWYRRNRRWSIAGKVMTVVGIAVSLGVGLPLDSVGALAAGLTTQYSGQLIWSASDLRGAKELTRRGVPVRRAAGITAVVGSLLVSPVTWIAGPIQSARIREAHARAVEPHARALGAQLSLRF